jgi:glycosyltransferase involved in cell wall biosynthesis
MKTLLYRRNLSLTSGAGQLIRRQAAGLRTAGERVRVACERGAAKFFLRTGLPVERVDAAELDRRAADEAYFLVDHQMVSSRPGIVFVHNLLAEGMRHLAREDWRTQAASEATFFRNLAPWTPVVANSSMVGAALSEHFDLPPDRVTVHRPGFDAARFNVRRAAGLRRKARRALRLADAQPLVGLITSGDFAKRGLDLFLEAAESISAARDDVRFLVVGSKRLPEWAQRHPLVTAGTIRHEPKTRHPEKWMAALDLFLYPARFEEFGLVVSEAQGMGVPVLTSRRVGAAECLPMDYAPWLLERPDAAAFAAKALDLLDDAAARQRLAAASLANAAYLDGDRYVAETLATIRQCRDQRIGH